LASPVTLPMDLNTL